MIDAVIYIRKSTETDDRQILSLEAQLAWARAACERLGSTKVRVFEDLQSAKYPGRPGFARMMSLIAAKKVQTVICWKADRLARNALDGGAILYALESRQLASIVTADRTYRGEPDEEFILHMELGLSAKFSKDLSRVVRRGIEAKWRRGEWASLAPIGYRNVRESLDSTHIGVDAERAPYVQQLFQLAATGHYSISQLARIAVDEWHLTVRRRNSRLGPSTIHSLLRNPFYCGKMLAGGEILPATHPPLISSELFELVQRTLTMRRCTAERPKRHSFTFTGLITCASCGRRLCGTKSGRKKHYTYYVCSNHMRRRCAQRTIRDVYAFSAVEVALRAIHISPEQHEEFYSLTPAFRALSMHEEILLRLRAQLADTERQQKRALDLLVEGRLAEVVYREKYAELVMRGERLRTRIEAELARAPDASVRISTPVSAWSLFDGRPAEEQKRFLRYLGISLVARDEEIIVNVENPLHGESPRFTNSGSSNVIQSPRVQKP